MTKHKPLLLTIIFFHLAIIVFAQDGKIAIPSFDDKYSKYVAQLEGGDLDIDYTDFRHSFLESTQYGKKGEDYDKLKKKVYEAINNKKYEKVIDLCKGMLSIDYTSMFAHKYLQQSAKILGDTLQQKKYHDIEFGLLNSIVKSGDGRTCETGWHVTQIEEEYFILQMVGAELRSQSVAQGGKNACDKMVVKTEKGEVTYYFEANKVFEMERKLFEK
jgi:hypothetical protein